MMLASSAQPERRPSILLARLAEHAAIHPAGRAVVVEGGELSFVELHERVGALARAIAEAELPPEAPVVLSADRAAEWVVGVLAILHAGCMYVPVDPSLPPARQLQIVGDVGAALALTASSLVPAFGSLPTLRIAAAPSAGAGPPAAVASEQAAYAIYTSGSTGVPKAVVISHGSLDNYAAALPTALGMSASDRCLHSASFAFSASMRQLLAPLVAGAAIVMAARERLRDPSALLEWIIEQRVTLFDTVPSLLVRWLDAVAALSPDGRRMLESSLRAVATTGEVLSLATAQRFAALLPRVRLISLYGQTETAGSVALEVVSSARAGSVPLGSPLGPTAFRVLGHDGLPVGEGQVGELCISGPSLARGYHARPALTAERFVPDPQAGIPGARMYRSGDRVRHGASLEYLGRADLQVKIHGVRIELGEVESALVALSGVAQAVAVVHADPFVGPRLVAYVVAARDQPLLPPELLRAELAAMLPEAMVPAAIVALAELPRTVTGKVDRHELGLRDPGPTASAMAYVAPASLIEDVVARAWRKLLRADRVGRNDDFFELGGDSMQAIVMTNELQSRLPMRLPLLALFFQDPTVAGFAAAIELEAGPSGTSAIERSFGAPSLTESESGAS
jgi:amino acid adenylation domain-containing protein